MKIHIFGASGSGVTTLGLALAEKTGYPYFDADKYFWQQTDPPFTVKTDPAQRDAALLHELSRQENWILGGSIVHWGGPFPQLFNLVVFLLLPPEIRLERLKHREFERYGEVIFTDPDRNKQYLKFLTWASGYDDNTAPASDGRATGRSIKVHRDWITELICPLVEITGDTTVAERVTLTINAMHYLT